MLVDLFEHLRVLLLLGLLLVQCFVRELLEQFRVDFLHDEIERTGGNEFSGARWISWQVLERGDPVDEGVFDRRAVRQGVLVDTDMFRKRAQVELVVSLLLFVVQSVCCLVLEHDFDDFWFASHLAIVALEVEVANAAVHSFKVLRHVVKFASTLPTVGL